ncbi:MULTISPECIES: hypothetical protein [unclassified Streptomyces]|uniref:hypothetical protein n=1 Tax=unclassified Streptomyces TaxID=2593676 RepID=UPI002E340C90|nr:hypothetical protein [Streptomyces sp. NBC_01278]
MSNYVVVAEIGLTKNKYGAEIRTSEPMTLDQARAFALTAAQGGNPDFAPAAKNAQVLRTGGADQYLVVEGHRLSPDSLTRLSVAEVVNNA